MRAHVATARIAQAELRDQSCIVHPTPGQVLNAFRIAMHFHLIKGGGVLEESREKILPVSEAQGPRPEDSQKAKHSKPRQAQRAVSKQLAAGSHCSTASRVRRRNKNAGEESRLRHQRRRVEESGTRFGSFSVGAELSQE